MKRVMPLKARKRINPKRSKPRRRPFAPNPGYLAEVRALRCAAPHGPTACQGPIEAHHMGERGLGQKAADDTAVPLCRYHHRAWHDGRGVFVDWDHQRRAVWAAAVIEETRRLVDDEAPILGSA